MMNESSTAGSAKPIFSVRKAGAAGTVIELLPAAAGIKYRVVGVQASGDNAAGQISIYHGATIGAAGKMIASAYVGKGIPFTPQLGDYGSWGAAANEAVSADVVTAAYDITLLYEKIQA